MKKIIALLLALAMCFSLCACGKSEAVTNVEGLIDAIGEVTSESESAITVAEEAYNALTEEEKAKVENYAVLNAAKERLGILLCEQFEESFVGEWVYLADEDTTILTVEEDGTATFLGTTTSIQGMEFEWSFEQDKSRVRFDGPVTFRADISYLYEYMMMHNFELGGVLVRKADYKELAEKYLSVAELTKENLSDYVGEPIYLGQMKDEWGDDMSEAVYCFKSNAYENDSVYLGVSEDFSLEILQCLPLDVYTGLFSAFLVYDSGAIETGRVKGKVCFISSEYVETIEYSDDSSYRIVTLNNGSRIIDRCRYYTFDGSIMKYVAEAGIEY